MLASRYRKENVCALLVRLYIGVATMENNMKDPEIVNVELPHGPTYPLLGIYSKHMETLLKKNICATLFITELFTVTKHGNNISIHKWMNE